MSSLFESLYWKSPIWLQQVAVALWGVGWYRRRFSPAFHRWVRELREHNAWTAEQFRSYQETRLASIFEAAWSSRYYPEVFTAAGIGRGMDPWKAIAAAPLLSKETLRTRGDELLTRARLPRGTRPFTTSGSTGTPAHIYYTPEFHPLDSALRETRCYSAAGVTYRDRRFMCGGRKICRFDQDRPPFWRFSPMENMAYASAYHLSPRFLPDYVAFLRRYRPAIVSGYPSALGSIARYALERGVLPAPARMIFTCAETVLPRDREAMEAAWQCRVFDCYGATELCVFINQCQFGRYHASPDVGIVEILDRRGQPCPPGVIGELVCTGLQNWLQPLIRYRTGDAAAWAHDQHCDCGRQMPIVEAIEGRMDDLLYTSDGRQVGRVDHIFKGIRNLKEAQVVQQRLDRIQIYVVPAAGYSEEDSRTIRDNMRLHLGDVDVRVEAVEAIARTPAGKFRAVLCQLSAEERLRCQGNPIERD